MTGLPYIIETALLLLVAFLVGCALGYALRRLAPARRRGSGGTPPIPPDPAVADATTMTVSATPVPARETEVAASAQSTTAPVKRSRPPADPRPPALASPGGGIKDDLKRINGIGPRIESSLNELGIFHFNQIARWSKTNIAWVDQHLSFKGRIDRENWVEQAKALSKPTTPHRKRSKSGT